MQDVARFTTEFIADEDRIRVALESEEGRVRLVWLTRRLLFRLVPRLIEAFDPESGSSEGPAGARQQAQQSFDQQAAVSSIQKQDPVTVAQENALREDDILAWGVDIQKTPKQITLVFKSKDSADAQDLVFNVPALRQWLDVLHRQFSKAGWDAGFWPGWISGQKQPEVADWLN